MSTMPSATPPPTPPASTTPLTPAPRLAPAPSTPPASPRRRQIVLVVALLVVALIAGAAWRFFAGSALPPGVLGVSGRIEGDDAAVAAKLAGRIREITVREGDKVETGQVIALLDDAQIRAREQQSEAALRQAQARVRLSQHQVTVYREQLRQNELGVEQSRADAEGRVHEAEGRLAAAEAQLAQAIAAHSQAKWERDAYTKLVQKGYVAEQDAMQKQYTEEAQAAAVSANRRQVDAARGAVTTAKANLANPAIRSAQVAAVQAQILQAEADIAAAQADAERAQAMLDEARANRADLQVRAPFDGTVATRTAEPGEVVMAGTPIVILVNLGQVYLRAFVPGGDIGKVRVGQPARVYLDSAPNAPIDAQVIRIDPEASFTPENTYFREDRVKQVVGVKLGIKGAVGFAKPGMPADGEILVDGQWPAHPARR